MAPVHQPGLPGLRKCFAKKAREAPTEVYDEDARIGPDLGDHAVAITSRRKSSSRKERHFPTEVFDEDARIGLGGLVVSKAKTKDVKQESVSQDTMDKLSV